MQKIDKKVYSLAKSSCYELTRSIMMAKTDLFGTKPLEHTQQLLYVEGIDFNGDAYGLWILVKAF